MMNGKPLMFDFFCGLGGASEGFLAEGWECVGIDNKRHDYGSGGYPGYLILQDITTFHGSQAKDAEFLWFSPPCTEFSYMAMPWSRGKQIARALRGYDEFPENYRGSRTIAELTALFDACFRIQREACEAAGRYIPMLVENVRGAQPWVGKAAGNYGSFYLWGDVPALMPSTLQIVKTSGHVNKRDGFSHTRHLTNQRESDAIKQHGSGPIWFDTGLTKHSSKSPARKAASAMIAKIPFALSRHIARCYHPENPASTS